jgi:UDP-N-acetyl-D-glucosamine dehydrogenase
VSSADCVVIITDHKIFDYAMILDKARLIVDTRNAIKTRSAHVFKLGAPAHSERS